MVELTDERLHEILGTGRMLLDALRGALNGDSDDESPRETLLSHWPDVVAQLRLSAESSAYVPNAIRWRKMADELEEWGLSEMRKETEEFRKEATAPKQVVHRRRPISWRLIHLLHNCLAHPLLPLAEFIGDLGIEWVRDIAHRFHDATTPPDDTKNKVKLR